MTLTNKIHLSSNFRPLGREEEAGTGRKREEEGRREGMNDRKVETACQRVWLRCSFGV